MKTGIILFSALAAIIITLALNPKEAVSEEKGDSSILKDSTTAAQLNPKNLPKLLDLGSTTCIPCKKMAPILEEMKSAYKGKVEISFIDVNKDRVSTLKYKVTLIPTQIFFDTLGVEVYRHVGFFPADSIQAHFKALGIE